MSNAELIARLRHQHLPDNPWEKCDLRDVMEAAATALAQSESDPAEALAYDPIPRYAQLDIFLALNSSARSEEYTPFREQHGFAETWARLCSSVRDQVARNDDLVNIATALNQDAFELQGDLDRARAHDS